MKAPVLTGSLTLLASAEGGRDWPIRSGFATLAHLPGSVEPAGDTQGDEVLATFAVELLEGEELRPGESARVEVTPFAPDYWTSLEAGSEFVVGEPSRVVGMLRIVDPLDPAAVEAWLRAEELRTNPPDLDERVQRIRRATDTFARKAVDE